MTDAPTIRELHRLGVKHGFPLKRVHEILHDAAGFEFGVDSLTACTPDQLAKLAEFCRSHSPNSRGAQADRRRQANRSGKRRPAGVVAMASKRQRWLINTVASELGWREDRLNAWLKQFFCVEDVDKIGTSKLASMIINTLIGEKRRQQYPLSRAVR